MEHASTSSESETIQRIASVIRPSDKCHLLQVVHFLLQQRVFAVFLPIQSTSINQRFHVEGFQDTPMSIHFHSLFTLAPLAVTSSWSLRRKLQKHQPTANGSTDQSNETGSSDVSTSTFWLKPKNAISYPLSCSHLFFPRALSQIPSDFSRRFFGWVFIASPAPKASLSAHSASETFQS